MEGCFFNPAAVAWADLDWRDKLQTLHLPVFLVVGERQGLGLANEDVRPASAAGDTIPHGWICGRMLGQLPTLPTERLGDPRFSRCYRLSANYMAGSMANGISSAELVIALGTQGYLSSFGSGGLEPAQIATAIQRIQQALPGGPYAFNLLYSPSDNRWERTVTELYLKSGIRLVEASAYLDLSPHIVRYRAAGLSLDENGEIQIRNRVIAKVSRKEVAEKFLQPAPERLLQALLQQQLITTDEARLAGRVPLADDITVEADSGGHTDNRPLVCLLPSLIALRDEFQKTYNFCEPVRIGAGGGIGAPAAAAAAFTMGAAYVVTGSVNQACVEAGGSEHVRKLLSEATFADMAMAPCADMFELGVKVQVLKRGTLYFQRAQRLYDLYLAYPSLEDIPALERQKLEKQYFQKNLNAVWQETREFFNQRDPDQVLRADKDPKRKMALIFRWYLGLSSRWALDGVKGREMDYQIWCGPAAGAFNDWVRGSDLEPLANRRVADIAQNIMAGAAYLLRLQQLSAWGISIPFPLRTVLPRLGIERKEPLSSTNP